LHPHVTARSDTSIHPEVLGVTVEIDKADRHHVHIVAISAEAKGPKRSISVPILRLADVDGVAVDSESYTLFAKQDLSAGFLHFCRTPISFSLRLRRLEQNKKGDTN
jgi:hypothetical protein